MAHLRRGQQSNKMLEAAATTIAISRLPLTVVIHDSPRIVGAEKGILLVYRVPILDSSRSQRSLIEQSNFQRMGLCHGGVVKQDTKKIIFTISEYR
jgi:hypothetical protein